MPVDYLALATSGVQALHPYQPGKPVETLERELGITNIIKLASNECPLAPSEKVQLAIRDAMSQLTRYPDGNGYGLKRALADTYTVAEDQLTLGNGSNDILELLARVFLTPDTSAVFSQYAFAVYPLAVKAVGAQAIVVPAQDWAHDLEAIADAIEPNTRLVYLANPNNPTGTWFRDAEFNAFMHRIRDDVVVVLDEAYGEYLDDDTDAPNGLDYLKQFRNLVVSRTFSKAYGLAALRVGYAISDPEIANLLNRVRQPFNVNHLALVAATAALSDKAFLQQSIETNRSGMEQLTKGLVRLGLTFIPSKANFVCVNFKRDAMPIYQQLLHRGVIVRPLANYDMPEFLRISVGLPEENARLLEALNDVL